MELKNLENQQNLNNSNKTNYWPYILGGIGIVVVIGIITYFLTRKKDQE
ncbi:MAG: hypothetical protein MRERV_27c002 [Mycoplasmataceae bacterium RV_VA103A]|nr:MAG: hypothetical protein MRERV_27c002 [Mycoplasmataceae bacterium RV_VA103A]